MGDNIRQTRSSDEDWQPEEMAARASQGDLAAFEALYKRYNNYVKETALQVLRSPEDAEDVAQNVWSKLLLKLQKYIPTARFTTWLYSVAVYASIDHIRRLHRNREIPLESIDEAVREQKHHLHVLTYGGPSNQEIDLLLKRIKEELIYALGELQDKNKIRNLCFQLYYFYGMSVREIAEEVSISEGTVKSHLYLARKYLEEKHPILSDLYLALQEKLGKA